MLGACSLSLHPRQGSFYSSISCSFSREDTRSLNLTLETFSLGGAVMNAAREGGGGCGNQFFTVLGEVVGPGLVLCGEQVLGAGVEEGEVAG